MKVPCSVGRSLPDLTAGDSEASRGKDQVYPAERTQTFLQLVLHCPPQRVPNKQNFGFRAWKHSNIPSQKKRQEREGEWGGGGSRNESMGVLGI